MKRAVVAALCGLWCILAMAGPVSAQTSALSGVVTDKDGGVVPGATVLAKNNATGTTLESVSNASGAFSFPGLPVGTYSVTVSLTGFKTSVTNDVRLLAGSPSNIKVVLELGALTETVEVAARAELVQTQSTSVTSTISVEQISNLPLVSRNALNFVTFLPGVQTVGGPRNSTVSGLPQNTINITIDGISNSNNFQSGDGFFSMVTPRLDAVEEITVTGATPGADGGGQGSVQIAFVTRSGTNQTSGSLYHYMRHKAFNTNYFFNEIRGLDRNQVTVHQYGGRIGGPIVLPGFDGRGKAFYFFNFEHFYQPTEVTRTRTIINERALAGTFAYTVTVGGVQQVRTVNVLTLAAANGQIASTDPTIISLLNAMRAAAKTTGVITTPVGSVNTESFIYQSGSRRNEYAPTGRLDYNITDKHRLSATYYWQRFHSNPDILNSADPTFPGFPNYGIQASYRTTGSIALRSTMSQALVNNFRFGWQWSPVDFFGNVKVSDFDNQGGYAITPGFGLTSATVSNNPQPRNTVNWSFDNDISWLKGNHSFTFGANFQTVIHNQNTKNVVPTIGLGFNTTFDPAIGLFNTTNFPGASTTNLGDARALYALLTGRVSSIGGTGRLNPEGTEYIYNGNLYQRSKMSEMGFFAQDSWRITPTFTFNYGLRWEYQFPFVPLTSTFSRVYLKDVCGVSGEGNGTGGRGCNIFQPGTLSGGTYQPQFVQFPKGERGFQSDWNNLAPNVGIAWRPNVQSGMLRTILGDPDTATFRAGFSMSFNRERMDQYTGTYGANPGGTTPATRSAAATAFPLVNTGESWPVLFRERNRLGQPNFVKSPTYPIMATTANSVNYFDENIVTPYTQSWSAGFQRSLGRDMAVEIRYVGNRNEKAWTNENWNAVNIDENGFFNEFKKAQANLVANMAAGRGATYAYTGVAGTSPLPIYLGYFSGVNPSLASDPSRYTHANFTSASWVAAHSQLEPDPDSIASSIWGTTAFRTNGLAAGYPTNFWVMNPAVSSANVRRAAAGSRYHSIQIDLRRRLANGLFFNANYTFAYRKGSSLEDLHRDRIYVESTGAPHAFKGAWTYDIPFGRGRRWGTDLHPVVSALFGNWEFSGTGRFQIESYALGAGNVLVGMTKNELHDMFKIRMVKDAATGTITVYSMPQDVIDNTRRAYSTDPSSPTGYSALGVPTGRYIAPASRPGCVYRFTGDCGSERIVFNGPAFTRFDMRLRKLFPFGGRKSAEVTIEVLNVFDNVNFNHAFNPGSGTGIFQVTSAYTDINTTYDPGGRIGQLVWRINW